MRAILSWLLAGTLIVWNGFDGAPVRAQQTRELQHLWEIDPPLNIAWEIEPSFPKPQIDLNGLDSPFAEDRVRVTRELCHFYERLDLVNREAARKKLIETLKRGEENLSIRRAMLTATALMGDASDAQLLWDFAKDDPVALGVVERALVKWKSSVAIEVWRQRLQNASDYSHDLLLALEGIAVVGSEADAAALETILVDNRLSSACKFQAARALGAVDPKGQNELAQRVLNSNADQRHLLAAYILSRHSGETTVRQLKEIIENGSASAQVIAYQALATVNPADALAVAPVAISSSDNTLRTLGVEVLQRHANSENLQLQATLLADRNPKIRQLVTKNLLERAGLGDRETVDEIVAQYLSSEDWQGVEQAIMLAVKLQDPSYCVMILELLDHPRSEVHMRAGWALMELAENSSVLAKMQLHAEKMTRKLAESLPVSETEILCLSYLLEAFGKNLYQPANDLLLTYVPKDFFKLGIVSRASAIWALGKLNRDADNARLRKSLHDRIQDESPLLPEDLLVRFTSILACGEMRQVDTLEIVEPFNTGSRDPLAQAGGWATDRIRKNAGERPTN